MKEQNKERISVGKSFFRYNVSAFIATSVDYITLIISHYLIGIYYPYATAIAATAGAVTAFFLGRHWAFERADGKITHQGIRFVITAIGSIILNTLGVVFFVEILQIENLMIAKFITSILVGFAFNYPMQRFFVYK